MHKETYFNVNPRLSKKCYSDADDSLIHCYVAAVFFLFEIFKKQCLQKFRPCAERGIQVNARVLSLSGCLVLLLPTRCWDLTLYNQILGTMTQRSTVTPSTTSVRYVSHLTRQMNFWKKLQNYTERISKFIRKIKSEK